MNAINEAHRRTHEQSYSKNAAAAVVVASFIFALTPESKIMMERYRWVGWEKNCTNGPLAIARMKKVAHHTMA